MINSNAAFMYEAFAAARKDRATDGIPIWSFLIRADTATPEIWIEEIGE